MRIAIDAREIADRPTGVGRYLAELLARWTRDRDLRDVECLLLLPRRPDRPRTYLGTGGASVREVIVPGRVAGTAWEQGQLALAVARSRADVLFAPAYTAPLASRAPTVVAVHDVSYWAHPEWFRWREGLRRRWVTRWAARRARAVLTLTETSKLDVVAWLGVDDARVHVINPAVDSHPSFGAPPEVPARAARAPSVLYVGSIFNRRHVPALVAAVGRLRSHGREVRLDIVGENRTFPFEDIDGIVARAGLAPVVRRRDYVPHDELGRLYAEARVFAFLSSYEGFGLTPLEALRAGVVPLVLDTPVAREAYGPAAFYVPDVSPDTVAAGLARLLDDDLARDEVLSAAPTTLGRYSWDRAARETMAVLRGSVR